MSAFLGISYRIVSYRIAFCCPAHRTQGKSVHLVAGERSPASSPVYGGSRDVIVRRDHVTLGDVERRRDGIPHCGGGGVGRGGRQAGLGHGGGGDQVLGRRRAVHRRPTTPTAVVAAPR